MVSGEIWLTVTAARALVTVICTFRVTAARDASVQGFHWNSIGPEVTPRTLFTVHACSVVLAVDADPSTRVDAFAVHAGLPALHIWVIVTVHSMPVAVTGFTLIGLLLCSGPPAPLVVARTAAITRVPTGVVLAFTSELLLRVVSAARVCVAVANTAPTNADVLYAVIIPTRDSGVSLCLGNKMPKQGVGSQKPQADVCRLSKLPQGVRESKIFCTRTTIYQGYNNLTIFQRHDTGILRDTEHLVILGDGHVCFLPKLFYTISSRMSKILPW